MIVALAGSLENRLPAVRALGAAVLCSLALAACNAEPQFDTSSLPGYRKSLDVINARLSEKDRNRLELALVTLAAGGSSDFGEVQLAGPGVRPNIEALVGVANPTILLDRMRPKIEGRTAAAVIRLVAADLDSAISRAEAQTDGAEKALSKVVIENPRYYSDRSRRSDQPTVQFSIYNGGTKAISHVYLNSVLTSRGRAAPWVTGSLDYDFAPALEPGAQQQATIFVNYGAWRNAELKSIYDTDLALTVTNADDTAGRRLLVVDTGIVALLRQKRDALRGG